MNGDKKEVIILTMMLILILLLMIGGIAFAYFAANKTTSNLNLEVSTANNMYTFETESSDNININLSFNDMSGAKISNKAVKSDKASINVALTNPKEGMKTTCSYDIVWVWDSDDKYTKPDVELPYTADDKIYSYEFSSKIDTDDENDLSNLRKIGDNKIILGSFKISAYSTQTIINTHTITAQMYNLPVDQPNLFNKKFAAHIETENVNCNMEKIPSIFDNCEGEVDLVNCIKSLDSKEQIEFTDGDGLLYHHTENLENGALDGGYRYSGNQPNNYICFGSGSEDYNNGEVDECPTTNKYRIIGLFPFDNENNQLTSSDGASKFLVKIIKAEYLKAAELGKETKDGNVGWNSNVKYKRIEADAKSLDGFHWNDKDDTGSQNIWENGSLDSLLNDEESGYLNFLYGEDPQKWENMIEEVKWNIGGWRTYSITPKAMYDGEMTNAGCYANNCNSYPIVQGSGTQATAKIGLMYNHDYGFATVKGNWNEVLNGKVYASDDNIKNNWLFNGAYEWTFMRVSSGSVLACHIDYPGHMNDDPVYVSSHAVRPVLYLNDNATIKMGENATGSKFHPYKVL